MLCVTYDEQGSALTAGQNGIVYKWTGSAISQQVQVHKGIIHCIRYIDSQRMVSGGADLTVKLLDPSTFTVTKSFIVDSVPRSVDLQTYLLVGLRSGTILEFDVDKNAKETIMQAHHDGESWGLCVIED